MDLLYQVEPNLLFIILCGAVFFDFITGSLKAKLWKIHDSTVGIKGALRNILIMMMVLFIKYISELCHASIIFQITSIWFIWIFINSLLKNLGAIGIPVPKYLTNEIDKEIEKIDNSIIGRNYTNHEIKNKLKERNLQK